MKKIQQGFTLIELMIVVAIIGILAAIALPAYQDYTIRAKMSEVITSLSPAKTAVSEFYISNGSMPLTTTAAGINTGGQGNYIASISYVRSSATSSKVSATLTDGSLDAAITTANTNNRVGLVGVGATTGITWACGPDATNGADTKYLPGSCRTTTAY